MARYDRIARIPPPARDGAFPGWLTLRDLDGRERNGWVGQRARLRFLVLRPVLRLLEHGMEGPADASFRQQLETVRAEVERLPSGDSERRRLEGALIEIGKRSPDAIAGAVLELGAGAEAAGHPHAAEEFYLTALEIGRRYALASPRVMALTGLGRVLVAREAWEDALGRGREAAALAEASADILRWAEATDGMARARAGMGDHEGARDLLSSVARRGEATGDARVRGIAAAGLCRLELDAERHEPALQAGLTALGFLTFAEPRRNQVLLDMAAAFRRLGIWRAAESCYATAFTRATSAEQRATAGAEWLLLSAEHDDEAFQTRRERLEELVPDAEPHVAAPLHLALARACFLATAADDARAHLRLAISAAREAGLDAILDRSDHLLQAMERGINLPGAASADAIPSEGSLRIAAETRSRLDRETIPAS